MDVIDQLENRHRQNDLRLLNVPEKEESGSTMIDFLVKTYMEKWKLLHVADDFERAHRCFGLTWGYSNLRPSAECVCGHRSYNRC